ncbi:MAG TPA: YihY/virulence factor BrkB family protein [Abditibacteriaceae bacterium]|jgi:membrane protein
MKISDLPSLLKQTYAAWNEDKAPRLGAALAYYTVFSLAPFLIIILAVAGMVFDASDARGQIMQQVAGTIGQDGADIIGTMVDNANHRGSGITATIIGGVTLLMGAGGLFGQLQDALNTIWGVAPRPDLGLMGMLRARFLSFSMVLGTAFLLLVSLALSAFLAALGNWMGGVLPLPAWVMSVLNFAVSFAIITLLFAMIFKVLPDAEIQWHDVWIGAAVTSLLFNLGKLGLAIYLAKAAPGSTYGAAGSLVIVLLWVYYAAQILFFGAEFTQVYASKFGSRIAPSPHAVAVTPEAFARQGIPRTNSSEAPQGSVARHSVGDLPEVEHDNTDDVQQLRDKIEHNQQTAPDWGFVGAIAAGFAGILMLGRWRDNRREQKLQRKIERELERQSY